MALESNADLARRALAAFNRGDLDGLFECVHPEITWHEEGAGYLGLEPVYHGREGLRRFFATLMEIWEWYRVEADEMEEVGDALVAHVTATGRGRASGVEGTLRYSERRLFFDRAAALRAVRESQVPDVTKRLDRPA